MKYTQDTIENDIGDLIPHGLRKDIAAHTGTYSSIMYAWLNGDDERKSPIFQTLFIMDALDTIDPAIGEAVWQKICAFREAGKPAEFKATGLSIERELGNLSKEITDVIVAKCEGRSIKDQLREIHEAERQLAKYKDAVLGEMRKEN